MNSRGQIRSWVVILVTIFTVSAVFVAVAPAWDLLHSKVNATLEGDSVTAGSLTKLNTAWQNWPLVFFFSMILVGVYIVSQQRRVPPTLVGGI